MTGIALLLPAWAARGGFGAAAFGKRICSLEKGFANLQKIIFRYGDKSMNELRARVISQEKGIYKIKSGTDVKSASVSGKYRYEARTVADYPAVGDSIMSPRSGLRMPAMQL